MASQQPLTTQPMQNIDAVRTWFDTRHMEQLTAKGLPARGRDASIQEKVGGLIMKIGPTGETIESSGDAKIEKLQDWTERTKRAVGYAKQCAVYGGNPTYVGKASASINWSNALLAMFESYAIYTRDFGSILSASSLLKSKEPDRLTKAQKLLSESTSRIRWAAQLWDLDFTVLVELQWHKQNKENSTGYEQSGPYVGAFWPTKIEEGVEPFIGISIKGTNTVAPNFGEISVDTDYAFVTPKDGHLWGLPCSGSHYRSLFESLCDINGNATVPAMTTIIEGVAKLGSEMQARTGKQARLHVCGHSLGGGYSNLVYAELLRLASESLLPSSVVLGDQYSFASPRVCSNMLAMKVRETVATGVAGNTWRVVSDGDPIPQTPPIYEMKPQNFVHLDRAVKVSDQSGTKPVLMESEVGTSPQGIGYDPSKKPPAGYVGPHHFEVHYCNCLVNTVELEVLNGKN